MTGLLSSPVFWIIVGALVGAVAFSVLGGVAGVFAGKLIVSLAYIAFGAIVGGGIGGTISGMHGQIRSLQAQNTALQQQNEILKKSAVIDRFSFTHGHEDKRVTIKVYYADEVIRYQRDWSMVDVGSEAIVQEVVSAIGRATLLGNVVLVFEQTFPSALQRGFVNAFRTSGFTVEQKADRAL